MSLRNIDLNLLVAFDALMQTRHVTRAAKLIGIGQPGMSAALSRLRHLFDDALLVKQGGEMVPTPRALVLEADVRRMLKDVERLVGERDDFDPSKSERQFSVRMSDVLSHLLLPAVQQCLDARAPGIGLKVLHLGPGETIDALERDAVELAVSMELNPPRSIESTPLFKDRIVVIARRDHPARAILGSLDGFLAQEQIKVAQSPLDDRFADRQLANAGLRRQVRLTVPHWLVLAEIVSRTDRIAVVPESLAVSFQSRHPLIVTALPLPEADFNWALYWHRRYTGDRGVTWLRDTLLSCVPSAPNAVVAP